MPTGNEYKVSNRIHLNNVLYKTIVKILKCKNRHKTA